LAYQAKDVGVRPSPQPTALGGQAGAASGAAFELCEQVIPFPGPLGGGGGVAAGLDDLGEGVVVLPGFLETEGFADPAGRVGVALDGVEVVEAEVDAGELD
jgi:hypothetical protein